MEVDAPQIDPFPVLHSAAKSNNAMVESEVDVGVPSRNTRYSAVAIQRTDDGNSIERLCTIGCY